jgi:hypothetical protein
LPHHAGKRRHPRSWKVIADVLDARGRLPERLASPEVPLRIDVTETVTHPA